MPTKFFEGLSNVDMENIKKIALRYKSVYPFSPSLTEIIHDITVYHQNFHKLDLVALDEGRDNTIKVVVTGLRHHIRNHPVA